MLVYIVEAPVGCEQIDHILFLNVLRILSFPQGIWQARTKLNALNRKINELIPYFGSIAVMIHVNVAVHGNI